MTRDLDVELMAARARFARSLVGTWSGALGTAAVLGDEAWDFRADGTGRQRVLGPFGHPLEEVRFEWRSIGERTLEYRVVALLEDGVELPLDDDDRAWSVLRYDFRVVGNDVGRQIALVGVALDGSLLDGLGLMTTGGGGMLPLAYGGPPGDGP